MAHAWKACWVQALKGSNPLFSANKKDPNKGSFLLAGFLEGIRTWFAGAASQGFPAAMGIILRSKCPSISVGISLFCETQLLVKGAHGIIVRDIERDLFKAHLIEAISGISNQLACHAATCLILGGIDEKNRCKSL